MAELTIPAQFSILHPRMSLETSLSLPSQIAGPVTGVFLVRCALPQVGHWPSLNIDVHRGVMIE